MKQNNIIYLIFLCITAQFSATHSKNGITFFHNHGRLGDVLVDYSKALYIALKHDLDLYIHNKIPYLHDFVAGDETLNLSSLDQSITRSLRISNDNEINNYIHYNTLYLANCYITIDDISDFDLFHSYIFERSIKDPIFGEFVRRRLTPKEAFLYTLPTNTITVAVHIRKGGGFDNPLASEQYRPEALVDHIGQRTDKKQYVDRDQPLKCPPEQYYVDMLLHLYTLLNQQPLYVYIFTDDTNPAAIAKRIEDRMNGANITFDYRKEKNAHNLNVIQDLYFMSKFDYLIASRSHYPWIAQMIGNHKAIISPIAYKWYGDYLHMHTVEILFPNKEQRTIKRYVMCTDQEEDTIKCANP